jgi:hypothetical protein
MCGAIKVLRVLVFSWFSSFKGGLSAEKVPRIANLHTYKICLDFGPSANVAIAISGPNLFFDF